MESEREGTVLRQEFKRWRGKHGGRGSRIPEALWASAVKVARTEGVYATARALRLNYERLKERVRLAEAPSTKLGSTAPAFVEVPMRSLGGGGRVLVELVGRGGEQMRFHLDGGRREDLLGLAEAFWSRS